MHTLISGIDFGYGTSEQHPTMRQFILKDLDNQPTEFMQVVRPVPSPSIPLLSGVLDHVQMAQNSRKAVVYQASFSLMAFGHDALKIREILIRMALSDNSPSATAILQSTLALASYHRDKDHSQADRLKIAALRALAASTQGVIGADESFRHIAAGMLLCTLEIYQISAASSHWLWYVCGSKKIIKSAKLDERAPTNDTTTLIGWVHYSDVLARFSLRHWQPSLFEATGFAIGAHFEPFQPAARTDDQRTMILDLISKTERNIHFRKLDSIKMMIQRIWVQNDLIGEEFNYVHKLGVVLSSANRAVPALV
ncbi:hypothetical protein NCS56_00005600 [Fusarium sp. Ph1]|nr:hypothetical protein NCS56_00005600 [Fusarium sp. Ph1]